MLRWLALAAVISIAFSEEATEISKGSDIAEIVESAPLAQEAAESRYPTYGRRSEERDRDHGQPHELRHHEQKGHYELHESHEPRQHELKGHYELHEIHKPHQPHRPHEARKHELKGHYELHELHKSHELHKPLEPRQHEQKGHHELHELLKLHELHKPHEPRQHEVKGHHEIYELLKLHHLHKPHELNKPDEPHNHELKGQYELHEIHKPHEVHKPHEPRQHEPKGQHELHELHKPHEHHKLQEPHHHDLKGHNKLQTDKKEADYHDEHEHLGPRVASFDPHSVAHHTPHGVGIIKDVLSPDYVQPTWFLDYRYVKTGDRDYAIADGGQVMILPEHVKNHEPKECETFAELLEVSRLKKLADKHERAHVTHQKKGHGLGYMRSQEDRMEQIRGRMVHEHDRHRNRMREHYED